MRERHNLLGSPCRSQPEFGYLTVVLPVVIVLAMARTASASRTEATVE